MLAEEERPVKPRPKNAYLDKLQEMSEEEKEDCFHRRLWTAAIICGSLGWLDVIELRKNTLHAISNSSSLRAGNKNPSSPGPAGFCDD